MKVKINFRVDTKTGEIIAVFVEHKIRGRYMAYSLYDGMHTDLDTNYIRECTRPARGYNVNELCAFVRARGYEPIVLLRMKY